MLDPACKLSEKGEGLLVRFKFGKDGMRPLSMSRCEAQIHHHDGGIPAARVSRKQTLSTKTSNGHQNVAGEDGLPAPGMPI